MILFLDIIEQLEVAEASLIGLVDKKEQIILPANYNKVLAIVNTGLADIFKRFEVRYGECTIRTKEGVYDYELLIENSLTANPDTGFILDDPSNPFSDEVIEVTSVRTLSGMPLMLNVDRTPYTYWNIERNGYFTADNCRGSFITPRYKTLRTPLGLASSELLIKYKVGHKKIASIPADQLSTFDPESLVIELPYVYLVPLVYYVISRFSNSRGTERAGQGMYNEGNNFFGKYLAECETIRDSLNQSEQTPDSNFKLRQKGFI